MTRSLLLTVLLSCTGFARASEDPNHFLLTYRPGVNWNTKLDYAEQIGIQAHKEYLHDLFDKEVIRMSGETVDEPGAVVLVRLRSVEQARALAENDPAVRDGILEVEITGWRVEMSSLRHARRQQQPVTDPWQPFKLERLDPESAINLKEE